MRIKSRTWFRTIKDKYLSVSLFQREADKVIPFDGIRVSGFGYV